MDRPLLILCEGPRDANYIVNNFLANRNVVISVHSYKEKDDLIRRVVSKRISGAIIIVEEGKQRLFGNIAALVSKPRSIDMDLEILAVFDSDSPDTKRAIENLVKSRIESTIRNRFPKPKLRPHYTAKQSTEYSYEVTIKYVSGYTLTLHLFAVPYSLEYWLEHRGSHSLTWIKALRNIVERLIPK